MEPGTSYEDLRIIFMGTPEFAVASLEALIDGGCKVVAVITTPDKPAGRGMEMQQSAVKKYASGLGLKVLQPGKLRDPHFLSELRALGADLQVCVAFRMLPEVVWNMPRMGTINLHGSLLPQYRGAAPINWAIIRGEKETGVTTFRLKHDIDTGNILLQKKIPIKNVDTAGTIHDKMKQVGATLLVETVKGLADGTIYENPQTLNNETLHHAPKIFTEDCKIDFNKPVAIVNNFIRGLSPYPAAFTILNGKKIKIFRSEIVSGEPRILPGEYKTDNKTYLQFACTNGLLDVKELQLEGKKKMNTSDFLRGYRFS